jgi:hypothetical protein
MMKQYKGQGYDNQIEIDMDEPYNEPAKSIQKLLRMQEAKSQGDFKAI